MNDIFVLPLINSDKICVISIEDAPVMLKYNWRWDKDNGYISNRVSKNGRSRHRYLHNFIFRKRRGIDHVNRIRLDCRRCNLRPATMSQNNMNRPKQRGESKFKGVFWNKINKNWNVQINTPERKRIHLGVFDDEIQAAKVYNIAAKSFYGEFALLNDTDLVSSNVGMVNA